MRCKFQDEHCHELQEIKGEIKDIKKDIRALLQFKWQIMGGTAIITFLTMTFIAILK